MKEINLAEVGFGLALISPADELLGLLASGGADAPAVPLQTVASAIIGAAIVAHGLGVWGDRK